MEMKTIKYEVSEKIATITLARPARMNAWTGRMHTEYRWALLQADNDPEVRAIILTGEGRGFCVGADSQALEGHVARGEYDPGTSEEIPEPGFGVRSEFNANFAYHFGLSKPIVVGLARHDCRAMPAELILPALTTMLDVIMVDMAFRSGMPFGFDDLG